MTGAALAHLGSSGADEGRGGEGRGGEGKGGGGGGGGRGGGKERRGEGRKGEGRGGEGARIERRYMQKLKHRGSLWQTLKAYRSSGTVYC